MYVGNRMVEIIGIIHLYGYRVYESINNYLIGTRHGGNVDNRPSYLHEQNIKSKKGKYDNNTAVRTIQQYE